MINRDLLCFVVIFLKSIQATLSPDGENVCLFDERYIMTIQVRELVPVKVLRVRWCWKFPPRCTVEETEMRPQLVNKEVPRTRIVPKCCRGFAADISEVKCLPVCSESCIHGICTAPDKCSCESGYYGGQCETKCPRGKWGRGCLEECDCLNGAICGHVNGECTCQAGWQSLRCEMPCNEGYYGANCDHRCDCHGEVCHHISGVCQISTTTEWTTTTIQVTTETTTYEAATTTNPYLNSAETFVTEMAEENDTQLVQFSTKFDVFTTNPPRTSEEALPDLKTKMIEQVTRRPGQVVTHKTELTSPAPVKVVPRTEVTTKEVTTMTPLVTAKKPNVSDKSQKKTTTTDMPNEIVHSRDYNTITGRSQIEPVSFFGLVPSLSLFSGIAGVIFLITMGSVMWNHHRKMKRIKEKQEQVVKINPADLGIHKFYGESTLPVKTIFENPVYSSDVDFEKEQPTLQSFKPLPLPEKTEDSKDDEIFRRSLESNYDHPPSPRSTFSEPVYHEISVIMDYDVPKRTSFRGSCSSTSSSRS